MPEYENNSNNDIAMTYMLQDDRHGFAKHWLDNYAGKPETLFDDLCKEVELSIFKAEALQIKIEHIQQECARVKMQTAFNVFFTNKCISDIDIGWFDFNELLEEFTGHSFSVMAERAEVINYYSCLRQTIVALKFDGKMENGIYYLRNLNDYDSSKFHIATDSLDDKKKRIIN